MAQALSDMSRSVNESSDLDAVLARAVVSLTEPDRRQALLSTPERRSRAVKRMEDDAEYSDNEQVSIIELFEEHPKIADSFLAISNKAVRSRYIRRALEKHAYA